MKKDDDQNHQDYDQKTIMDVFPAADNRGLFRDYNSLSAMVAVVSDCVTENKHLYPPIGEVGNFDVILKCFFVNLQLWSASTT